MRCRKTGRERFLFIRAERNSVRAGRGWNPQAVRHNRWKPTPLTRARAGFQISSKQQIFTSMFICQWVRGCLIGTSSHLLFSLGSFPAADSSNPTLQRCWVDESLPLLFVSSVRIRSGYPMSGARREGKVWGRLNPPPGGQHGAVFLCLRHPNSSPV